jgi:hypothetical protein
MMPMPSADRQAGRRPAASHRRAAVIDAEHLEGKAVEAVLDLARAGFNIQRIVDVIPEPDPEIYAALAQLLDSGAISFDAPD